MISSTGAARHGADGTLAVVRSPDPISGEMKGGSMGSDIVVPSMDEVRCYIGQSGAIVLARDPREWEDSTETEIVIPRSHVLAVIERMQSLLGKCD